MKKTVLVESRKYYNDIRKRLSAVVDCQLVSKKTLMSYENNADVIAVACSRTLARQLQSINLPNCKLIQLESVGFDNVDLSIFKNKGICVCNAKSIYDNCLAEYVVFAMLLYAKRFHRSIKNWIFRPFRNYRYMTEIAGKTVGVMGVGQIGGEVAKRLSMFGVNIIGYANNTKEKEYFSEIYHKAKFAQFLSSCDFLINVLPHDDSTIGLLNKNTLHYLKPTVAFINIGRESIYVKKDLVTFFKANRDAVAILDIFEVIPRFLTNPLRRLSNVLIMPRVSAISRESDFEIINLICANINSLLNNKELQNIVVC